MAVASAGQATSRELKRVLSVAGWSAVRAAKELGVNRRTVHRWLNGDPMSVEALSLLAEKSHQAVRLEFGQQKEAAPPEWAKRLATDTAIAVIGALAPEVEQRAAAAVLARIEGTQPQSGGSPRGSNASISPDEPAPREQGRE